MKVRVKKDMKGFIYGSLRKDGAEFTLKSFEHPRKVDGEGNPLVVSAESQFSKVWMEKVKKESTDTSEDEEENHTKNLEEDKKKKEKKKEKKTDKA